MAFKLFAWEPATGMYPWCWVYPASQTPLEAVVEIANHFDFYNLAAGQRAIYIDAPVPVASQVEADFVGFFTDGPDWSAYDDWYEEFWGLARSLTPRIDYVILDWEQSLSYWHLNVGNRKTNIAALQAVRVMPPELNAIDPVAVFDDFLSAEQRPNVNALNAWLHRQYSTRLKDTVTGTMVSGLGYEPSFSNFEHHRHRVETPLLDRNGWNEIPSPLAFNSSGLGFTPHSTYSGGAAADLTRLTNHLNESEGRRIIWVSYPSYAPQGEANFDAAAAVLNANNDLIDAIAVWNPAGSATGADNTRIVSQLGGL
jgi:hypothetical protein